MVLSKRTGTSLKKVPSVPVLFLKSTAVPVLGKVLFDDLT